MSRNNATNRICQGVVFICVSLAVTGLIYQSALLSMKNSLEASQVSEISTGASYFRFVNASAPLSVIRGHVSGLLRENVPEIAIDVESYKKFSSEIIESLKTSVSTAIQSVSELDNNKEISKSTDSMVSISLEDINNLQSKISDFLLWVSKLKGSHGKDIINWSKIANSEIHMLNKLFYFLENIKQFNAEEFKSGSVAEFASTGYRCSEVEAMQQEAISKSVHMDICSEIEWYKLVQLCWPEASTFIDVGANKGYLGSLFVSLWGSNWYNVTPAKVFDIATKTKAWTTSRNPAGYCRDGYNHGLPLFCQSKQRLSNGECSSATPSPPIQVFSVDGSSYLAETLNYMIKTQFSNDLVSSGSVWKYFNFAVSDREGTVSFTKQTKTSNPGFEGGRIRTGLVSPETEEVNMTTVDNLVQLFGLHTLDVLKIDTEGNDNKVIIGASSAIRKSVKLFTFEGGSGVTLSKEMLDQYDELGFSCYSTSRAGLFKWTSNCMMEKYMGSFSAKDKGNIFCASRHRIPLVTLAFDALSFPLLIHQHRKSAAVMKSPSLQKEWQVSTDTALLSAAYINIKPFCQPWPNCVVI